MLTDRNHGSVVREILVGCKYAHLLSDADGADEKIGVRALNPSTTALIRELTGGFKVLLRGREILKCLRPVSEPREPHGIRDAGEQFPSYWTDHRNA